MKAALDTSVVVAFLSKGGPQQEPSLQCYRHLRATGAQLVIADRVLIEAFSVLSGAPRLFSLPPRQAQAVLVDAFSRDEIIGPPPGFAWDSSPTRSRVGSGVGASTMPRSPGPSIAREPRCWSPGTYAIFKP